MSNLGDIVGGVTFERLMKLLNSGLYMGCLAVVTRQEPDESLMHDLCAKAFSHFRTVDVLRLDRANQDETLPDTPELAFIYGLEAYVATSPEAYAARTLLDVRRNSGLSSIICLDIDAFQKHFLNSECSFYLFCDSIEQDSITELTE